MFAIELPISTESILIMTKTTPEEAQRLADKHNLHLPGYDCYRLAALIDEVRGVDSEPVRLSVKSSEWKALSPQAQEALMDAGRRAVKATDEQHRKQAEALSKYPKIPLATLMPTSTEKTWRESPTLGWLREILTDNDDSVSLASAEQIVNMVDHYTHPAPSQPATAQPVAPSTLTDEHRQELGHEFAVRLSEYGIAMAHRQGEKARVLAEVLQSMFVASAPAQQAEPDMRAICEVLGFDPTNHHNAAKCPYCRPATPLQPVTAEVEKDAQRYRFLRMDAGIRDERPFIAISSAGGISQWTGIFADKKIDTALSGTGSTKGDGND